MGNLSAHSRLCLVLLVACSGGEEPPPLPANFTDACAGIPGCERPDIPLDAPPMAIWRVLVARDAAGAVRIEDVHEIDVSSAIGVPQGPLHGALGLAALNAAGEPLEVQHIRFPTTRFIEDFDGSSTEEDLTGLPVSAVGYLEVRAEVETLAVFEGEGVIEHSMPAPAPGEAVRNVAAETGIRALIQGVPTGPCAHVMVLDGVEDARWNAAANPMNGEPAYAHRPPSATQLALVRAALGRMTAVHCIGVGRIGFVDRAGVAGSVASWEGDFININLNYQKPEEGFEWAAFSERALQDPRAQALFEGAIMHEAAHTTVNLLRYEADDTSPGLRGMWTPTPRSMAADTIDRVRLRGDILELWSEMHESFVDLGWGDTYFNDEFLSNFREAYDAHKFDAPADIVAGGFMSPYGGTQAGEDIAEFATWPIAGSLYDRVGLEAGPGALKRGYACPAMAAHASVGVPSGLAATFTKITFMRDLGFTTEANYQACIGSMLGLPHNAQGITIYESEDVQNTFGNNPEARIEEREDDFVFVFEARGSASFADVDYSATLTLEIFLGPTTRDGMPVPIEEVSWPRGAFPISPIRDHAFRLRLDDEPAGNFDVTDGFVLVAGATNERLVGSVFVTQAFRYMAPVPVPQTFMPPLQFRFLLEN